MALFLAIVAPSVALVIPFLFLANLNGIDVIPSCRGIVFPIPLLLLLLNILPSFIRAGGFLGSVDSEHSGAGFLPSANFASLGLDSSGLDFLPVIPWVRIFEAVLLEGWWFLEQRTFESRTMVLDLRPALASTLTAFYTISLKSMGSRSCYSISTLIKSLRPFLK